MENRKIEILSREAIDALSDEERAARRERIDKITAYEAHDIVKHFADMGYNHFRSKVILERAMQELQIVADGRLERNPINALDYPIGRYGDAIKEEPPTAETVGGKD